MLTLLASVELESPAETVASGLLLCGLGNALPTVSEFQARLGCGGGVGTEARCLNMSSGPIG